MPKRASCNLEAKLSSRERKSVIASGKGDCPHACIRKLRLPFDQAFGIIILHIGLKNTEMRSMVSEWTAVISLCYANYWQLTFSILLLSHRMEAIPRGWGHGTNL